MPTEKPDAQARGLLCTASYQSLQGRVQTNCHHHLEIFGLHKLFNPRRQALAPRRHHPRIVDTMRAALLVVQLAAVAAEHLSVEYPACTDAPGASFQYSDGFYYSCPTLVNSGLCGWCWGDGHGCVTDTCPASCSPNCVSPPPPSVPPFFPSPPPGPPTPPFAPSTPLVPGDCSVVGKMTDTPHDVAGAHAPS